MLCQVVEAEIVVAAEPAVKACRWHPEHVAMGSSKPPFAFPLSQTMISELASASRLGEVLFLLHCMARPGVLLLLVLLLGSWMAALGYCWYWGRGRSLPRTTDVPTY